MNRIIAILALLLLTATEPALVAAQPNMRREMDPKQMIESRMQKLDEQLDLSDAQSTAILALHEEFYLRVDSLRGEASGNRHEMMEGMRSIRDDLDASILELLDDTQKKAYEEFRDKEREEMRARFRDRPGHPPHN